MAALTAGTEAPDISLSAIGGGRFSLQASLKHGPVIVAFFKVSCPVCQYTLPFLERMHQNYAGQKIAIVGVSQNEQRDTAAFLKEFGITFPTLLDDPKGYAVSNAYGLTNVPTLFLIGQDGRIEVTSVGWVKQDMEDMNRKIANGQQTPPFALFRSGENVSDYRPG
jgi:peroxiredoxin